jgi:ribonucleoside-diphosphate reductase alpha chain
MKPIQVVKRNGRTENVSFDKITRRIAYLLSGELVDKIDPVIITQKVVTSIVDGITTTEIDTISANICISMSVNNYYYGILASRIVIDNHQKNTETCLLRVTKILYNNIDILGEHAPLVCNEYYEFVKKNYEELNKMIDFSRDFNFSFFGFKTLENSYLYKIHYKNGDSETSKLIERPQHLWMRVAIQLHMDNSMEKIRETYNYLSLGYFTHATPTLYHSGSRYPQLASCFLLGSNDSIEGIYKNISDCAKISKWAGGIGIHISMIRSKRRRIRKTNGLGSGLVPMLKVYNDTALYVNQSGKRFGSFAVYLEPHHPDIIDFINARNKKMPEKLKAEDLFYGLWVSDHFMDCVENDREWYLLDPDECPRLNEVYGDEYLELYNKYVSQGKYVKKIQAREIWDVIFTSQIETGMPYMCYKDAVNRKNNQKNIGTIKSSNLCVSGDTLILTKNGYHPIYSLENKKIKVWNGKKFSETIIRKTGENVQMNKVSFNNGLNLKCTDYHRFYVKGNEGGYDIKKTEDLCKGDVIIDYSFPIIENGEVIKHPYVRGAFITSHGYFLIDCKNDTSYASRHSKEKNDVKRIKVEYAKTTLAERLEEFGYPSDKKINIKIFTLPEDIDNKIPINGVLCDKLEWLAGFLDASDVYEHNGEHDEKYILIDPGNYIFNKQILLLFSTLGIIAFVKKNYIIIEMSKYKMLKTIGLKHNGTFLKTSPRRIVNKSDLLISVSSIQKNYLVGDTYCFNEPEEHKGIFNGILTGNCTEIMEYSDENEHAVCNLSSIAVNKFIIPQPDIPAMSGHIRIYGIRNCEYCLLATSLLKQYNVEYDYIVFETEEEKADFKEKNGTKTWPQIYLLGTRIGGYSDLKECILPRVDYDLLAKIAGIITENLNSIIDKNFYPTPETEKSNKKHRPIGIGIQGLADLFAILEVPFESEKAKEINRNIFESIYYGALCSSVELAKKYGPYETFQGSPASKGILQYDMWEEERLGKIINSEGNSKGKRKFDEMEHPKEKEKISNEILGPRIWDFDTLKKDIIQYGLRNSLLIAPMPTASTSQILGNMEAFEPFTSNIFRRTTIAGDFPVVNQHLVKRLNFLGLYTSDIIMKIVKDDGSIQNITEIPREIRNVYKTVWEIPQKVLIDLAADRGIFIDQSQSLNIYLQDPVYSKWGSMHFYGWKKGLKTGSYYIRTPSGTSAQKFTIEPEKTISCESCSG